MILPDGRGGPYLRALLAAARALELPRDQLDLSAATAHLGALDPDRTGDLFAPAEVDDATGMPAWTWLHRAHAEQALVSAGPGPAPTAGLPDALARRLAHRHAAHTALAAATQLPLAPRVTAVRVRDAFPSAVRVALDAVLPDGTWLRARIDLALPVRGVLRGAGPRDVELTRDTRDRLARAALVPLPALLALARDLTGASVPRTVRAAVGPLWFPGLHLPDGTDPALGAGLLLHARTEELVRDRGAVQVRDPLDPAALADPPPVGYGGIVERRLAAFGAALPAARDLAARAGCPDLVTAVPVTQAAP